MRYVMNLLFAFIICFNFLTMIIYAEDMYDLDYSVYENRIKVVTKLRTALNSSKMLEAWPSDLPLLQELLSHESDELRWDICATIMESAKQSKKGSAKRKQLISYLVRRLNDDSPFIRESAKKWLLEFDYVDFDEPAKQIIENKIDNKSDKEMIMLVGLLNLESTHERIKVWASQPLEEPLSGRFYGTQTWAALLVLARQGDKDSIKRLLTAVDQESNLVTRVSNLLEQLEYVRQPEVVEYIKKYLDSNERLESTKPTVKGIKYAQYAAVSLAKMLKGFPVVKEDLNYTEEELSICRRWMVSQNDWQFQ